MILAILSLAQFTTTLEFSIIYIALPSIASDLNLEPALAQWVLSAYAVLFAGFLTVGGRLTDRIGAKPAFLTAVTAFGLSSALGGAAANGTVLLAARCAQGVAAALLQPAVLSLISRTFQPGEARNRALATWSAIGASGLAAGAILGGLLTSASWRFTFFINVPLTMICAIGATMVIRQSRQRPADRIPLRAAVLCTGSMLTLVLGLTLGAEAGWTTAPTLVTLGSAVILFCGFGYNERTARNVLIARKLRGIRSLHVGAAATALYMASVGSAYYLLTLLLQSTRDYTPLQAGLAFLPLALMVTIGSGVAGRVTPSTGLVGGFAIATVGTAWFALSLAGDFVLLLPGLILSGLGNGAIFTSMFIVGTRDVPAAHQGTASALLTTSQYLSSAVTVAVLTLVLGPAPAQPQFRLAFLLIAGAAAAGALLGVGASSSVRAEKRPNDATRPRPDAST